jgi:hypothetical protein
VSTLPHLAGLTEFSGKNLADEAEMARLNDLLAPAEAAYSAAFDQPSRPIVFVLGPPRSGTTLVSQALAATGAFGVTSNFVARFWRAPAIAFHLQRSLGAQKDAPSFQSTRGRTSGAGQPHEFGYYWSSWFDLGQNNHKLSSELLARVDAAALTRSVAAMEAAAGAPLMLKNNSWFTFQASWLAKQFPTGVFVACVRDPFFVAQSIYAQRLALGDVRRWWSIRPPGYGDMLGLTPLEQVAAQAVEIEQEMHKELASVPPERLIRAGYQRLCEEPRGLVAEVFEACARVGEFLKSSGEIPEKFTATDQIRLPPHQAEDLKRLVQERLAGL